MRAHLYLRISLDRTGDELGVTRQREDAARLVEQRGWSLIAEHVDNDTSAAGKVPRPAFEALLAAVERDEVDVIVAWAFDRLARNARDRLRLVEACQTHRVMVALVRGSDMDPTTPSGRFAIGILGEVAQMEIATKSDRQGRAAEQAAHAGKVPQSPRAFGWNVGRTALVPAEATAIRDAYRDVLAGVKLAEIARRWNAAGLLSGAVKLSDPHPRPLSTWRAETVKALLIHPRNAALRTLNGREVGPGAWPGIVEVETFRAAHALLTDPSRRQSVPAGIRLLSGLATCGECGATVQAGQSHRDYATYRCRSRGHVARRSDQVDEWITDLVVERLSRPDARDLLVVNDRPDVEALRTEANALRAGLETLAAEFGAQVGKADALPVGEYRAMRAPITERIRAIEAEMIDAGRVDRLGDLIGAEDVRALWGSPAFGRDRQRAVVDALMAIVLHPPGRGRRTFDPDTIEVTWRV